MLLRPEMMSSFARAAVQRLRSGGHLDVDERAAVLVEQKIEELLRSGLTAFDRPAGTTKSKLFRAPTVIERRTAVLARSRPRPRVVAVTEETLGEFLSGVEGVVRSDARVRAARGRVRAALRAVPPPRSEVDPESLIAAPGGWVPSGDPSGGAPPAGAAVGDEAPESPPWPSDGDGFDLD